MWVGWWRRREGEPWQRGSEGATLEEAAAKLTAATKGRRIRNTNYYLTGGGVPPLSVTKEKATTR